MVYCACKLINCKSLAFGSCFTSFSRVLPTSRVGYHAGKPIESVVYCLNKVLILCGKLEVLWSAAMKASTSQTDFCWDELLSTKRFQGNCFDCFAKIKPFSGYFSAYGKDFTFSLSKRWHTCKSARVWVPCKFKGDILLQISQGCSLKARIGRNRMS